MEGEYSCNNKALFFYNLRREYSCNNKAFAHAIFVQMALGD